MRLILLMIATLFAATVGVARGDDDDDDDRGRGYGRYSRGDKDRKEYFKWLEKQQREDRKRYEEFRRDNERRYRDGRGDDDDDDRRGFPHRAYPYPYPYPGGSVGYRHRVYRNFTPLVPQPGGYGRDRTRAAVPYWNLQTGTFVDELIGEGGAALGYGQDGHGGVGTSVNPGVVYGPGPGAPYPGDVPPQPASPYGAYPLAEGDGGDPARQEVAPYPGGGPALPEYTDVPPPPPPGSQPPPPPDLQPPPPDLQPPPPDLQPPLDVAPTGGQITALADQLAGQADAFIQAFTPKIGIVPEGPKFMVDATALRNAAVRFREFANQGAEPAVLAVEFRNVAAGWQRFEARMLRVSKGRIGPTIATSLQMGKTIEQIRQLMP